MAILIIYIYVAFIVYILTHLPQPKIRYTDTQARVTVIIPCRNEAETIGYCLDALIRQTLPGDRFDVIVVDDFSEDVTVNVAEQYSRRLSLRILRNQLPGKKNALAMGMMHAATDIIITTDADCTMGPDWLSAMLHHLESCRLNMLCGPVNFNDTDSTFEKLQQTESAAIVGISAAMLCSGKPATCNGANLMFRRSIFDNLGGYSAHRHLASGDDDLLMHAFFKHDPEKVAYSLDKAAMVFTRASSRFNDFLHQRIRWMGKRKYYLYPWNAVMQSLVFAQLLAFYFLLYCCVLHCNVWVVSAIILKYLVDLSYGIRLRKIFRFSFYQILVVPFFESYILLVLVFSFIKRKQWKGRSI